MKKALLVKKDMPVNTLIIKALEELDYSVEQVSNFRQAAEAIRQGVDAVITGYVLESMPEEIDQVNNNGATVAMLAQNVGVANVKMITSIPEQIEAADRMLLGNTQIISLSELSGTREDVMQALKEKLA